MSVLTVKTGWIVGTPNEAAQLVSQITAWVVVNTEWTPGAKAQADIKSLTEEIVQKYDHPGEGYCAFATQIVDGVLNRLYPYLIEFSAETGREITSNRKKEIDSDQEQVIAYTLESKPGEPGKTDENGDPILPIEGNPYPKPVEIDDSPVLPIPGAPQPRYDPVYPGIPYNPLAPLNRDINPYPVRAEQPTIPYVAGGDNVGGSPIQDRNSYVPSVDDYRSMVDALPRASEVELDVIPSEGGEGEKPKTEEPRSGEGEPKEEEQPEEEPPSDLLPLLRRILYEIENQGALNREAITAAVLSILGGLTAQTAAINESIASAESLLSRVLQNNNSTNEALLKQIVEKLSGEQEEPEGILGSLLSTLGEALDETNERLKAGYSAIRSAIEGGLEATGEALGSIGYLLESGFDALVESVESGLSALNRGIAETGASFLTWLNNAFEFDPEQFSTYLCKFLTEIENCKDCNYLSSRKEEKINASFA